MKQKKKKIHLGRLRFILNLCDRSRDFVNVQRNWGSHCFIEFKFSVWSHFVLKSSMDDSIYLLIFVYFTAYTPLYITVYNITQIRLIVSHNNTTVFSLKITIPRSILSAPLEIENTFKTCFLLSLHCISRFIQHFTLYRLYVGYQTNTQFVYRILK